MGILDRFRAAFGWERAYRLSSHGRYEAALRVIQSINAPPTGPRTSWSLFEVLQLSLLKRHAETLRGAIVLVDQLAAKDGLSANERYFLSFARWAGAAAFHRLFPATPLPKKLEQDFSSFRLADVQLRWKRTFALLIHPDWVAPPRPIFGPWPAEM
jgi:hypothetical protein